MISQPSDLTAQIELYGYECEAGPLIMCTDWIALKAATDLWVVVKQWAGEENTVMHTDGKGGWRFMAHTNEAEAQSSADRMNRECYGGQPICVARHIRDLTTTLENRNKELSQANERASELPP